MYTYISEDQCLQGLETSFAKIEDLQRYLEYGWHNFFIFNSPITSLIKKVKRFKKN